jgi:5-(carboxyamino)imidazole ribonucleotide mutase
MGDAQVAIIMGSDSDWPVVKACYKQLEDFGLSAEVQVISAHRTPDRLTQYVARAEKQGVSVFIAAAGMAAALPGAVAALTSRPVIGVPLASGALQGVDSLLSIVQMPPGVPVATVAVGSPGAKNAAVLAAQIIALARPEVADALKQFKADQAQATITKNAKLQEQMGGS